ncbi:MAG: response regulator transcription factor [Ignavibacteria bacterium]|jgi:DNA-binding response OmpR family regulator|nr:response regulator transcription factor [Ignavibacteria bacterium]MCU7504627.1 response regulator transcription factor [Ignavibacteria bacterium]MCU7517565.1 response regulator transcription factor [Ignavibacteria bacterium]
MKKILVIEDEHSVRTSIRDLLEEKSYKVFSAADGREGVALAKEILPDLVICDVMMPFMDGYEVIRELYNNKATAAIPFIFLSAKAEMPDMRLGMELGADDYLVKPFRAVQLLNAIEARLNKSEKIREIYSLQASEQEKEAPRVLREDERLFVSSGPRAQFIKVGDIVCISAESEYSNVRLADGNKVLIHRLLKEWEEVLPEALFLRIHRSTIINLNFIDKVEKWYQRSFMIKLKGVEEPLTISQRYASKIKAQLLS